MLPAITTMPSLLLMACFTVAASATGEGNSNQMLQPVVLPETTLADAGVPEREVINMTLFEWMYSAAEEVTHLTICAQDVLLSEGEVMKTNITLVYWMDERYQTDIEGVVLGVNQTCSLFSQAGSVYLAPSNTHYHLSLILSNSKNNTIQKSGSVSFGMPVQTSTLYCHEKPYTRVSGLPSNQAIELDQPCIKVDQKFAKTGVCYLEGEFSSKNLCYTTTESDLQVCLQGSSQATAQEAGGRHSISYLAYRGVTDPAAAHLFLEFDDDHKPTEPIEAIIWKQNISFVTSCLDTNCLIPDFTRGFAQYDVCAVTFDSSLPAETSTSNITDLNADAFKYDGSKLLQFDFTNANEERFYTAYVETNPNKTVNVDCSAVPLDRTCHGYFEENSCEDLIVAVQYANATMDAKGNKIRFSCRPFASRRR